MESKVQATYGGLFFCSVIISAIKVEKIGWRGDQIFKESIVGELTRIVDIILIFLGFTCSLYLFEAQDIAMNLNWKNQLFILACYLLLWLVFTNGQNLYQSRRFTSPKRELKRLVMVNLLTLAIIMMGIYIADPDGRYSNFALCFAILVMAFTLTSHVVIRNILQLWRRMGNNRRYILLVGSGPAAEVYVKKAAKNPQLGYKIIGYIAPVKNCLDLSYLGSYELLEEILRTYVVDLVVVTASLEDNRTKEIIERLHVMGKSTAILMDDMVARLKNSHPVDFGGLPMVLYSSRPRRPWHELAKRGMDIGVSALVLIVFSPLFLVVGIIIIITSKGPVFFSQERVGINGRTFKMVKFRSMVSNAEELKESLADQNEMSGPVFKITNDPRVTPIGKFIRKTSIDELPQLWNVLLGEMSLVGPRPPLPSEVDLYDPKHRKRLEVRPGITCIWQVSGRNAVDFEQWMEMDADYIDRWSLWLDVQILAKTVPVVLMRRGAS